MSLWPNKKHELQGSFYTHWSTQERRELQKRHLSKKLQQLPGLFISLVDGDAPVWTWSWWILAEQWLDISCPFAMTPGAIPSRPVLLQSCLLFRPTKSKIQVHIFGRPAPVPSRSQMSAISLTAWTPPENSLNAIYFPFSWTQVWGLEQEKEVGREQGVYSASKPPLALAVVSDGAASVTSD